ncbi:DUF1428 domain-containing protein [Pseudoxanthomonas sp. PXM01]|nr:DUF1428 domain-containing protein [Pseudoxanthomonas sp. PXM01]
MPYIDGFVAAVPTANKQKFIDHASLGDPVFIEQGATRVMECWEEDVPDGKVTDFRKTVQAKEDESVVFSWIEWPDKATRDAGMKKMMDDPRMSPENNPMPFDGKRLIYGGFVPALELGKNGARSPYVDGFVLAVPTQAKAAFTEHATLFDKVFMDFGATRIIEGWGDDVPRGKQTDFYRAVQAKDDETVAFSWVEWPDKATRDAGMKKMMEDPRMDPANQDNPPMPFDGKRMIFGGFTPVVELHA